VEALVDDGFAVEDRSDAELVASVASAPTRHADADRVSRTTATTDLHTRMEDTEPTCW
jgi:hypothetical protein